MTIPLALYGASGHAKVVLDAIRLQGRYHVAAVLDDRAPGIRGREFAGVPVIGGRDMIGEMAKYGLRHVMVAFGDCDARLDLAGLVRSAGLEFATVVHPRSVVAKGVTLGAGTFVAAGVVINPETVIGEHVIINTSASVDHECVIDDGVHICPGVHAAGRVRVGRAAWVGIGSILREGIAIGARAVIGAGAVVLDDIPSETIAYGIPARVVGARTE